MKKKLQTEMCRGSMSNTKNILRGQIKRTEIRDRKDDNKDNRNGMKVSGTKRGLLA